MSIEHVNQFTRLVVQKRDRLVGRGERKKGGGRRQNHSARDRACLAGIPRNSGAPVAARHRPTTAGPRLSSPGRSVVSSLPRLGSGCRDRKEDQLPAPFLLDITLHRLDIPEDEPASHNPRGPSDSPPMADTSQLKARVRADYPYILDYRTRW